MTDTDQRPEVDEAAVTVDLWGTGYDAGRRAALNEVIDALGWINDPCASQAIRVVESLIAAGPPQTCDHTVQEVCRCDG